VGNYAILRLRRLKSLAQVASAERHNARTVPTPSADKSRRGLNRELVPPHPAGLTAGVRERLPAKVRSNAVRAVEVLFSTSRPVEQCEAWALDSVRWACQRWGAENVLSATLHRDEPLCPPHVHLVFVPLIGRRLCAKEAIGNRHALREMQDSYAQAVRGYGLQRGSSNPFRRHIAPAVLRNANLSATEQEQRAAVGQVRILRAEIAALKGQLRALREASTRFSVRRTGELENTAQRARTAGRGRTPCQEPATPWSGLSAPATGIRGGGREL